jgi:RNA polymerase sigma factor (sigma-70 family)
MDDPSAITELIHRVRAGDQDAATEFMRRYEPLIRREVRLRMEDRRLGRLFDSSDICQSVMASFFVRTAAGQYDLDRPDQVLGLLVSMARNKVASAARRHARQRRDRGRDAADGGFALGEVVAGEASPSRLVAGRELWEQFRASLGPAERDIADLRSQGRSWAEVADRLGGTAQARRMQLSRAVERVARALGLDEDEDEDGGDG